MMHMWLYMSTAMQKPGLWYNLAKMSYDYFWKVLSLKSHLTNFWVDMTILTSKIQGLFETCQIC
jgi:hypothetical protein